jgi:purine-nucleoside phosphorylase
MEAFGLFANAKHLGKNAATILTFRILFLRTKIFRLTREKALKPMIELALEAGLRVCNHYRSSKIKSFTSSVELFFIS